MCSRRVEGYEELVGIQNGMQGVIREIDAEIARQSQGGGEAAQRNIRQLQRVRAELQQALEEGRSWDTLSDDARGRLGERMIQNLTYLPGINRTIFGPLTKPLINNISRVARVVSKGQIGNQLERMCGNPETRVEEVCQDYPQ